MMERRQFFKNVFGVTVGLVVVPSVVKAKEKPIRLVSECINYSMADEHLDMLRRLEAKMPDSAYLEGSEMQCFNCGRMIQIKKGYYRLGECIECPCGNKVRFVMNVKLRDPSKEYFDVATKEIPRLKQKSMDDTIIRAIV